MTHPRRVATVFVALALTDRVALGIPDTYCMACANCGDDPACVVEQFFAYGDQLACVIGLESGTASYSLEEADSPQAGLWGWIATLPAGQREHSLTLPPGTGRYLRLVEIETDGSLHEVAHAVRQESASAPAAYAPSAVESARERLERMMAARASVPSGGLLVGPKVVIYTRSAWIPDLQPIIYQWSPNYTVVTQSIDGYPSDPDLFRTAMKQSIASHAAQGDQVLLARWGCKRLAGV
jgi:hypothetical protein